MTTASQSIAGDRSSLVMARAFVERRLRQAMAAGLGGTTLLIGAETVNRTLRGSPAALVVDCSLAVAVLNVVPVAALGATGNEVAMLVALVLSPAVTFWMLRRVSIEVSQNVLVVRNIFRSYAIPIPAKLDFRRNNLSHVNARMLAIKDPSGKYIVMHATSRLTRARDDSVRDFVRQFDTASSPRRSR